MKLLLAAVLASFVAAVSAGAQGAPSDHWDARITAVTGEVLVRPAGGLPAVDAKVGMPLEEGDRVVTLGKATADLSLDGGSLIFLSENSDFALTRTKKDDSLFSLAFGSLLAKIQKLGSQRLGVRTATSVASVRGTEFGVDAEVERSRVGVFDEGRVEVSNDAGMEVLTPNQETLVSRGHAPLKASPLKHFDGRREFMRGMLLRLETVHENWKKYSDTTRRKERLAALKRLHVDARRAGKASEERQKAEERKDRTKP